MDWNNLSKNISKSIESAQKIVNKATDIVDSSKKYLEVIQKGSDILQGDYDIASKGSSLINLASSTINEPMGVQATQPVDIGKTCEKPQNSESDESDQDGSNQIYINEETSGAISDEYSFIDAASIATGAEAVSAIAAMGSEIAKTIRICQIEETKRTQIKANMEVEVARINSISKLLSDYLDKTFDERAELFDNYFRVLDKAIAAGDAALMSATLGSINSLAAMSPFKNLADFATVQQQLRQADTEWDI